LVGAAVVAAGAVAGWAVAGMDPGRAVRLSALVLAGGAVLVAIAIRPEVAALVTLVLVTVIPIDRLFEYDIRALSGGITVTDLLLAACLASWLVHHVLDPRPLRLPSPALTALLLVFVALGAVGVLTARAEGVELKLALLELRAILALLLVFPIVDGVRRAADLEKALVVFLVAVAVGAGDITRDFVQGRGGIALFSDEAIRINNLVYVYSMAGAVWAFSLLPWIRDRRRWLLLGLTGLCLAALFVTVRRGAWLVVLLAPVAVLLLVPPALRRGFVRVLAGVVLSGVLVIAVMNEYASTPVESPLTTARERLLSLGEGEDDISTGHRLAELREARRVVADHPVLGIGLGASVSFVSPLYNPTANLSDVVSTSFYLHDSYVWVAVKLGLGALAVFLALLAVAVRDAYAGYRKVEDPRAQRLMLGGLLTIVGLIAISFTEPHLTYVGSSPLLAAAVALTQVVPRLAAEPP
jgi:O-antigen ligase